MPCPDVSPFGSPPTMAPPRPPIIPRIPIASPKLAATVALDATVTHRAGCAATAVAMVPCCTSEVNISVPMIAARTVVSHVEKMNVRPTVNGRSVSGSISTKVARIHDSATPMTGVSARIVTFERSDDTLIHSLRSAVGIEAVSSRRDRWRTRTVGAVFATRGRCGGVGGDGHGDGFLRRGGHGSRRMDAWVGVGG